MWTKTKSFVWNVSVSREYTYTYDASAFRKTRSRRYIVPKISDYIIMVLTNGRSVAISINRAR